MLSGILAKVQLKSVVFNACELMEKATDGSSLWSVLNVTEAVLWSRQ